MKLAHRTFGTEGKPPLIILHGLLGSSRNWVTVGKAMSAHNDVHALDLRNLGDSPHDDDVSFGAMADDVREYMDDHEMDSVHLLGHSLGGKVAMSLAITHPERVRSLIIVDIAPKSYRPHNREDFETMRALDLAAIKNRKDADDAMKAGVPDFGQRQFLLTNLKRDAEGKFYWGVNLEVLYANMDTLRLNSVPAGETYTGPTLFMLGEQSRFVRGEDHTMIRDVFPAAQIRTISGAGHNVHAENAQEFLETLQAFLSE